jgi:molybdopterin converting factor small subunit
MEVKVLYFASARQLVGVKEEQLLLPNGASTAQLKQVLLTKYPQLEALIDRIVLAVNLGKLLIEL